MFSTSNRQDNYSDLGAGKKNTNENKDEIIPTDYAGSVKVLNLYYSPHFTNMETSGRQERMWPASLLGPVSIYRNITFKNPAASVM